MNTRLFLMIFTMVIMVMCGICSADTIVLKNGQTYKGKIKKDLIGNISINGRKINKDEIKILAMKGRNTPSWYQGIVNFFGLKTDEQKRADEQKDLEERRQGRIDNIQERLNKNSQVLKEMDRMYDKERRQAKRNDSKVLNRARKAQQVTRNKEMKRKREFEQASKDFFNKENIKRNVDGTPYVRKTITPSYSNTSTPTEVPKGVVVPKGAGSYYNVRLNARTGSATVIQNTVNRNGSITTKNVSSNPPSGIGL